MRSYFVLLLLIVLLISPSYSSPDKDKKKPLSDSERLAGLLRRQNVTSPVLNVNAKQFKRYVDESPRSYHVFLLYTTTSSKHACGSCDEMIKIFGQIAERFHMMREQSSSELPIFFLSVDAATDTPFFHEMGINSVPQIVHIPPVKDQAAGSSMKKVMETKPNFFDPASSSILDYFESKTAVKLNVAFNPEPERDVTLQVIMLTLPILFIVYLARRSRALYFIGCLCVVLFVFGGGHYNIIRDAAWYYYHPQQKKMVFIHPSPQTQFGLEGLSMAFLEICGGLAFLGVHELIAGDWLSASKIWGNPSGRLILITIFGFLSWICIQQVIMTYSFKNRSYLRYY